MFLTMKIQSVLFIALRASMALSLLQLPLRIFCTTVLYRGVHRGRTYANAGPFATALTTPTFDLQLLLYAAWLWKFLTAFG
jgi:hypothetical protein